MNTFIDTHCHLTAKQLYPQATELVLAARMVGVTKIIIPGTQPEDWCKVTSLVNKTDNLYPALGIHPFYITEHWQSDIRKLEGILNQHQLIAIGEIGLDFIHAKTEAQQKRQIDVFAAQLELADRYNLPVLLHNRKSLSACITLLQQHQHRTGGIAHAFNGSLEQVRILNRIGLKVGINTIACRPNTPRLQKLIKSLPDDSFVLETDAPDMAPVPNTTNYPENIPELAQKIADIRNQTLAHIAATTNRNASSVLAV